LVLFYLQSATATEATIRRSFHPPQLTQRTQRKNRHRRFYPCVLAAVTSLTSPASVAFLGILFWRRRRQLRQKSTPGLCFALRWVETKHNSPYLTRTQYRYQLLRERVINICNCWWRWF